MRTLDRITAILDIVAASPGTGPAVVARQINLPLPTVSRLMRSLAQRRYLQPEGQANGYGLGSRLLELSYAARPTHLLQLLVPEMEKLRDAVEETVSLHVRAGDQRICICEVQSGKSIRRVVPVGFVVPLHFGATGLVLLAFTAPAFQSAYINGLALSDDAERELRAELALVRKQGWAMAEGSWNSGIAGVAAPIQHHEFVVASLAVSGPIFRWNRAAMMEHVEHIAAAARRASAGLSGVPLAHAG